MKNKEIIIYDNYFSLERERETRQYLFDDFAEENGWQSPEDISDNQIFDEMYFQDQIQWENIEAELKPMLDKNTYLLTGFFGSWHGEIEGGTFIRSFNDFLSCIKQLEYIRFYDVNGHFYIHGSHHDGSDDYELKMLTDKGYEYAKSKSFDCDKWVHKAIKYCNFYSALPYFAKKVYGV